MKKHDLYCVLRGLTAALCTYLDEEFGRSWRLCSVSTGRKIGDLTLSNNRLYVNKTHNALCSLYLKQYQYNNKSGHRVVVPIPDHRTMDSSLSTPL
jgi:hypothetical protein